jgi:hypothetical protein
MAEFGFAYTLGSGLAQPIQNAIVQGFQIGVGFMTKPFEYFANRLGERMQDELSDLKAAGGFFSMAKRQESPFVKNFADAIQFTQENNKVMARLAASLPGKTQDYIEVAKRVSDSVARTVLNDRAATMKMAEQIRAGDIRTYGAKSITEMTGSEATRKTIQVLLGDLTKDTVLAGMGGRAGAGGAMGAYGLPQLSERMISQDEVSMGQMQRYSAIFSDPMIMDALQRNINKINATSKNSADRLQAIANMYKEIVTPELVERYRRTLAGVQETFNTAIFGEETGLFGLGRKMEGLGIKFNEYGQMLDKQGEVTTKLTEAAREDLAIYDLFRDILVNVGQVLAPIVENLNMIYDPLKQLGLDLNKAREVTYKVLQSFNQYRKGFENYGIQKQFKGLEKEKFDATRDLRAALLTIGNVMAEFKVIGEGDFANLLTQLKDPNAQMGPILQKMIDQFMTSDVAGKIGEFIGTIVGTVLTEVAKVTGFISGRLKQSNKLFEGLKKGFDDAGGPAAFRAIFRDVFMSIGKLLLEIAKIIPIEAILLGAAMIGIPAAVQGLGMLIAQSITAALGKMGEQIRPMIEGAAGGRRGALRQARRTMVTGGGIGEGLYRGRPQRYGAGGSIERLNRMRRARAERAAAAGRANMAYAAEPWMNYAKTSRLGRGLGGMARGVGKMIPGGAMAAGAMDLGLALATGENFGKAAVGAFGTVLGATAGTVFGPVGTAIGGMAGNLIADKIYNSFDPATKALDSAAKALSKYGAPGEKLGGVEQILAGTKAKDLPKVLEELAASGKLSAEEVKALKTSGFAYKVVELEKYTDQVEKLKKQEAIAEAQNLSSLSTIRAQRIAAEKRQQVAAEAVAKTWETFSAGLQTRLIRGSDGVVRAFDAARDGLLGWIKNIKFPSSLQEWVAMFGGGVPSLPGLPPSPTQLLTDRLLNNPSGQPPMRSHKDTQALIRYKGGLGDAIASEMRMKPPGSDLVIANSSETVIPAAGGYGMIEFVDTLKWGFATMISTFKQAQQKNDSMLSSINQTLKSNQQQTNMRLSAMEKKFASPGMPGGLGGGAAGGVDAFTPIAQRMGLTMTSGYRPGDPGWHGANRARDFSNGTGPTPQMMQFAQYMASTYGSNLKELIYTPLGFSIKNGQRVAPYAQGSHYNHVHVAYGLGQGNPAFFGSQSAAQQWERSMMSGSIRVGSVTGNSAEGFGSTINGGINVTVHAGSTNDPDQLAYMVAERIQAAVGDAVNSNILV